MDHYSHSPSGEDASTTFEQQIFYGQPENEGDLTDEYIVNMMHEIQINHHGNFDYQPMKLFDPIQDVFNIPVSTTSDVSGWYGTPCQGNRVPSMLVNSESCGDMFYPTSSSPNVISGERSPASFPEPEYVNSPQLLMPTASEVTGHALTSSNASPYSVELAGSPVSVFQEPEYDDTLPTCSFEKSSHTLPLAMGRSDKRAADEHQDPPKKRRGRRPRSAAEKAEALAKRQAKAKKIRVYEIDQPFENKELERKRVNAVNAKKHRDQQKEVMKEMDKNLADVIIERDILKQENGELLSQLDAVSKQLEAFQKYFGIQTVPL